MKLEPFLSIPTSGARNVALFTIDKDQFLAFPQLAEDIETMPASMNGGNSETHAQIYRWTKGEIELDQQLPVHGGEHIDFAIVDHTPMLAIANIRSGQAPKFNTHVPSQVFARRQEKFELIQELSSVAAKSVCFFSIDTECFLGVSEGVLESESDEAAASFNHIYIWQNEAFELYQALPSVWGYDMTHFQIESQHFLGVGDNIESSKIYVWQDKSFQLLQNFDPAGGGRGFCHFSINGQHYLAFANLLNESRLYRWNGKQFEDMQTFEGAGARSFHFANILGESYLFRTNFITGTRDAPITKQTSLVYQWQKDKFVEAAQYTTFGGTDAKTFEDGGERFLVVSNSLNEDCRFRVESMIYKIIV